MTSLIAVCKFSLFLIRFCQVGRKQLETNLNKSEKKYLKKYLKVQNKKAQLCEVWMSENIDNFPVQLQPFFTVLNRMADYNIESKKFSVDLQKKFPKYVCNRK